MQADDATVEGETTEIIPEPIQDKDSSPQHPLRKKKPRNVGVGTRKIVSSPKVSPTPKTKKEKKATSGKGEKATNISRKMISIQSANSSQMQTP